VHVRRSVENDARGTGVNQLPNALTAASGDDVPRAEGIHSMIHPPRSPDARHGCRVKYHIDLAAGFGDGTGVLDVTLNRFHTEFVQALIPPAAEDAHVIAPGAQLLDDV